MILTMRVTAKGQITIPQKLRDQYGLGPGTEVEVVAGEDGPLIRASRQGQAGARLIEQLRDSGDSGLSADEILRLTRGDGD